LIGVALPQAGAAGVAAVFWLTGHGHSGGSSTHLLALAGSLAASFGALGLLVAGQRRAKSPAEWGVGALFAASSAATILFIALNPTGDIEMASLLCGELLAITVTDLKAVGAVLLAVGLLFFLFRRDLLLTSFDPEFARTLGRDPIRFDLLLYFLIGGSIALGVMTVGPLMVFGYLVLPALAALRVAPSLPRGTLPENLVAHPIAVLPFVNATAQPLTIPEGFLDDMARLAGNQPAQRRYSVPDALQQRAAFELERRGYQTLLVPVEQKRTLLSVAPGAPVADAEAWAPAGFTGSVLTGTLRRFTLTGTAQYTRCTRL